MSLLLLRAESTLLLQDLRLLVLNLLVDLGALGRLVAVGGGLSAISHVCHTHTFKQLSYRQGRVLLGLFRLEVVLLAFLLALGLTR